MRRQVCNSARLILAGALLGLATGTSAVAGSDPPRPIVLVGDIDGAIANQLRAELGARGFEVQTAPVFEPAEPFPTGVAAILRVEEARRRVEIWTPDLEAGGARFRTAMVARSEEDQTMPVRAAEGVRVFVAQPDANILRPVTVDKTPVSAEPPPASPVSSVPASTQTAAVPAAFPPPLGLAIGVDATLLIPGGGPSAGGAALLRARYDVLSHVSLGMRVLLPVVPPTVSHEGSSASVAANLAAAEAYFRLRGAQDSPWEAGLATGVAVAWLRMAGVASAPLVGRSDDVWTALPFASVEIASRIGARVRLRASLLAGLAVPDVKIRFAGESIASWGAPLTALTLGVDFDL